MGRPTAALLLALAAVTAFVARSLGVESVFTGDGSVVFALGDAFYHARRALFSFEHWPKVLLFDPLLNYPGGADVPWPPLYDLLLAGVARLFGSGIQTFERVAAWVPVALGVLTILPVYAAGRVVGGRGLGIAAAFLFALLPATIAFSNVGNIDHHAAQGFLGAVLLAASLRVVAADASERVVRRGFVVLALARSALCLVWPGSILYVAVADGCLLAAGVLWARRDLLLGEAASALASALFVLPVVLVSRPSVGGPFSATYLSMLHVVTLVGVAGVAAGVQFLEARRPSPSAAQRALRAGGLGVLLVLPVIAATGVLGEVAFAFDYVAKTDAYAGQNLEQFPLFRFAGGFSDHLARQVFGFFAYLIPFAPLAALAYARDPDRRGPALVLAGWSAVFGALALYQTRFGNDYAPSGSVALALLLHSVAKRLVPQRREGLAVTVAVAFGLALLLPVFQGAAHTFGVTLAALRADTPNVDRILGTYPGTMIRFAQQVRAATPETAGFDDPGVQPEYGILAYPGIGHVLHYTAHRATPADNFGPYIGPPNYSAVGSYFGLRSEAEAVAEAERLRIRYIVTTDYGGTIPYTLVNRLHRGDGSMLGYEPAFGRFRLVTEGPEGGLAIGEVFGRGVRSQGAPYKLFEIVPGAVLEIRGEPGETASAEVLVETPLRRRFLWRTATKVEDDGIARIRVPYATQSTTPVRPVQPYRVSAGGTVHAVTVTEDAVLRGASLSVGDASP